MSVVKRTRSGRESRRHRVILESSCGLIKMSIRALSSELEEIARRELNEDPNRLAEDLQHIKDWIAKQPHLNARIDDQWLLTFLRGCKFSLERTKQKIDLYYALRTAAPELTLDVKLSYPRIMELFDALPIVLPQTSGPADPRIILVRPGDQDLNKFTIYEYVCASYLFQQVLLLEDDRTVVAGVRTLFDCEGATVAHFTALTPTLMKKLVVLGQDGAPIRMKGLHYINTPPGFETAFNIMKNFLNEKNKSRIHVHNKNYDELYQFIPKELLPEEYGGKAGTMAQIREDWKKKILAKSEFFEEETEYKTDESKRVGSPRTSEEMFGVEGSFRQLTLD